jgi:hypothetical protein
MLLKSLIFKVIQLIILSYFPNNLAGIPGSNNIRWNIPGYDTTRT